MILKHGMKIKCYLEGHNIEEAKISIDPPAFGEEQIFICQNTASGNEAQQMFGYKYSWLIGSRSLNYDRLTELAIINRYEIDILKTQKENEQTHKLINLGKEFNIKQ
ncbi:MAG: hypothetical protein WCX46_02425 [Candidatus Paceibacterota bacterium]